MQSSGAKRIRRLAATGMAGEELRRENAPAKLLGLLHEGADPGQLGTLHPCVRWLGCRKLQQSYCSSNESLYNFVQVIALICVHLRLGNAMSWTALKAVSQVPQLGPSTGKSCSINSEVACGNAGVSKAVVEALEAICKEHDGMEATIRAGTSQHETALSSALSSLASSCRGADGLSTVTVIL